MDGIIRIYDSHILVDVLGSKSHDGKSSLAVHFVFGEFPVEYESSFKMTWNKTLVLGEDEFELDIVDSAGHNEHSIVPHAFVLGINGYIVVYSIGCERSFQTARKLCKYLVDLHRHCARQVKYEEGKNLANSCGAAFMEVSAKSLEESMQVFNKIICEIGHVERAFWDQQICDIM
ncbi:GTPase 1 [Pelobates cultripes]|uniref:GTPase 1 n=1 Tax=Pelobates cultripes TaxID=61616 RepID=A0AAD1R9J5_PELCU|nr:GTPase 1 [Pelobates cultripes]